MWGLVLQSNIAVPGGFSNLHHGPGDCRQGGPGSRFFSRRMPHSELRASSRRFRCRTLYLSGRCQRGAGHSIGQRLLGKGLRIRCSLCGHRSRGHAAIGIDVVCACTSRESREGFVISCASRFVLRRLSMLASADIGLDRAIRYSACLVTVVNCLTLVILTLLQSRGSSRLVEARGQDCGLIRLSDVL